MWVCHQCLEVSEDDQWEECWNCGGHRDRSAAAGEAAQRKIHEIQTLREQLRRCPLCQGEMKFRGHREIPYDLSSSNRVRYYETEKVVFYACTRCGKLETFLAEVGAGLRGDPDRHP